MSITHHPSEQLLLQHAAGELDEGQSLAIATHLEGCASCRTFVHALEEIGGDALDKAEPVAMQAGAFAAIEARLPHAARPAMPRRRHATERLPASLQPYDMSRWRWVAPGVSMRPIMLPKTSRTRAFLLKSTSGVGMLQHSHSGIEMTCVLSGSFSHAGGEFAPGDFDFGDTSVEHQPVVGAAEECICLVAMTGELRLQGLLGRMMQPFIRL